MTERRDVMSEVVSKASAVTVRNVMNPLLWLNAVVVPPLLVAACFFHAEPWLAAPLVIGALALPGWTLLEYRHFARHDPQRLHSEEYLMAQQRLMLLSKNSPDPIDVATVSVGANPELRETITGGRALAAPCERLELPESSEEADDDR